VPDAIARIVELLSTSESRWRTLHSTGREWRNQRVLTQAWETGIARDRASGLTVALLRASTPHVVVPPAPQSEEQWELWLAPPWKRARFPVGDDLVDVVFHESTWRSNGHGQSNTNEGDENDGHGLGWGEDLIRTQDYVDEYRSTKWPKVLG
jgi:hypothetical protein